jgi:ATP-dependent Clp endopeptidase proteolytic subunit ClpP
MKTLPDWLKLLKGSMDDDGDEPVEMLLSANIGYDPVTGQGIDAECFVNALHAIPRRKTVKLNINSLGGRIDQGTAMGNAVSARGNVTTCVIGYAASMGAMIHQAGAIRQVMPGTMIVLHNPMGTTVDGDHREHTATAERLAMIKSGMVDILAARTKNGKKKISELMDATTFMDSKTAMELGFADELVAGSPVYNSIEPTFLVKTCRQLQGLKNYSDDQERDEDGRFASGGGKEITTEKTFSSETEATQYHQQQSNLAHGDGTLKDGSGKQTANEIEYNKKNDTYTVRTTHIKNHAKQMKTLIAALHKAKLLPTADLTDEAAVVSHFETNFSAIGAEALRNENVDLKAKVVKFESEQKTRVTNAVKKLVADKLVKADREAALIAKYSNDEAGLTEFTNDLVEAKGAPQPRRGAPAVPVDGKAESDKSEIESLRAELNDKDTAPARKGEIAKQLRDLRGHKGLFAPATK